MVTHSMLAFGAGILPGVYATNRQCRFGVCRWTPLAKPQHGRHPGRRGHRPTTIEIQPSDKAARLIGSRCCLRSGEAGRHERTLVRRGSWCC